MTDLEFDGRLTVKSKGRFNLALDSLALYTNAGFKASMTITLCMLVLALAELVYTLVVFATGHPVAGWTTTMFVITVGFAGLFAVLTIVVKIPLPAAGIDVQTAEIFSGEHRKIAKIKETTPCPPPQNNKIPSFCFCWARHWAWRAS